MILNSPLNTLPQRQANITDLDVQLQLKQNQEKTGAKSIDTNRKGDFWEYHVALEAWRRGAEVFMNIGRTGKTDLVLEKDGNLLKVDVKQMRKQDGIWKSCGRKKYDSHHVLVNPETREIRWIKGWIPAGWENFW